MIKKATTETHLKKCAEIIIPIDKLSNLLFNADINCINSITEDQRLKITSPVKLVLPKDDSGNPIPITPFDKLMLTLALSEQLAGNDFVSYTRIFHDFGGGDKLKNHASKVYNAIEFSFWKLRHTDLFVDMSTIIGKRKKYATKLDLPQNYKGSVTFQGVLLPNEIITAKVNNNITNGVIHFLDSPILFDIADLKNQIARCDINLLAAPIRNTEQTVTLKFYLLERILKIKGSNAEDRKHVTKLNNTILFDTLFNNCGLSDSGKNRKSEYRQTISQILDYFKKLDFISEYEFVKDGDKFLGIKIFY